MKTELNIRIRDVNTSLVDYPSKVCNAIFVEGCNLHCPFCHNWSLFEQSNSTISIEDALKILNIKKALTSYVVVTGGEPTIYDDLPYFIVELYDKGFKIKLDTNGLKPDILEDCLPYLSYVALDLKTSLSLYPLLMVASIKDKGNLVNSLKESIRLLKDGKVDYEFRTTVVPKFVGESTIHELGKLVRGCRRYAIQQFVPDNCYDPSLRKSISYSATTLLKFTYILRDKYDCKYVELRI